MEALPNVFFQAALYVNNINIEPIHDMTSLSDDTERLLLL